jgi:hypothetical protein
MISSHLPAVAQDVGAVRVLWIAKARCPDGF